MTPTADPILVIVLLLNLRVLGSSQLRSLIFVVGAQGVLLGMLALSAHGSVGAREVIVAIGAAVLKGVAIPRMLLQALRDLPIRKEIEPIVSFRASLLLGAVAIATSLGLANHLPVVEGSHPSATLFILTSFATVLSGFLVLTTRIKAITQVVGYLVLENGVYIFGLLLLDAMPFLVEVGVLLDLFVAIFVMGIIINHISREFASTSTEKLSTLKE
jgi:hydrogenase-4 component E